MDAAFLCPGIGCISGTPTSKQTQRAIAEGGRHRDDPFGVGERPFGLQDDRDHRGDQGGEIEHLRAERISQSSADPMSRSTSV